MLVTFEGPEGAGKTSVIKAVADRLRQEGREVAVTREPGAGTVGAHIREILLHGQAVDARTELFLFLADRANHVATVIRPALQMGAIVLCDRHADSTVVYQAHARGLDASFIRELNTFATGGLRPDLTILLDVEPEVGLARLKHKDRIDSEPLDFHQRVREGFLTEARRERERWRIVDASRPLDEVAASALAWVQDCIRAGEQEPLPFEGLG